MAVARTYEQMARAIGEPTSNVQHWAKMCGAPFVHGQPNDVDAFREWLANYRATQVRRNGGSETLNRLREARVAAQVKREAAQAGILEMKLKRQQGQLVDRSLAEAQTRDLAVKLKIRLLALPKRLAAQLANKPRAEVERLLSRELETLLRSAGTPE